MKYALFTLFLVGFFCGCRREKSLPDKPSPPATPSAAASGQYPQWEWTLPGSEGRAGGTASLAGLRQRFYSSAWTDADNPEFTLWLAENEFFRIEFAPDSNQWSGTVQSTADLKQQSQKGENRNSEKQGSNEKKDHGTMTDGIQFFTRIRITEPFEDRQQAFRLLEAYLKRDGAFEKQVRWADPGGNPSAFQQASEAKKK